MGDDQPSPSSSRGKHRRSSDDASDEEPKRRKHHHHRQHRRHRHHSKHGEYRNEEDEPIFSEKKSEPALRIMPADDELEEGEIVEEEEGGGEIEYGEVRNDHAAPFPMQEPSCEEDLIPEHTLDISSTANNMKALINCCAKENDKDGGFLFEATVDTPNNAGDYGNLAEVESSKKLNPLIGVPKKEKHRDIDLNGFKSRDRPRSPAFKKSSYLLNPTDKDDHLSRYFDPSAEKERSTPKLGRQVDEKSISVDKNFSISPRSPNDRHKETERSSSSSKHCGEIGNRDQSMCDDHATGKLYNQVREDDAEECIPLNHSERQIEGRNNSDYKRSRGHDRLDKYIRSDRESHKERESSVYSRHNGHDSRHSSRDRLREGVERRHDGQDKGKEVESSINGFRDRDEPPNDKGVYRDREMSRCSSRYDGREDRHGRRDKERYKDREREKYSRRDRERVKERDRSRDRFMVIERIRNVKGESARNMNNTDQDKSRNRERKNHSYKDRERVDHKERNPNCYHDEKRDSRRSKYDNMEPHKERTKYNESAKDATINIHYSEEEKRYHLRVEDVEDYQGRIEQQLAMQDEEDIEKIKEESRKRRQAILEKYKQKQNLENFEPSPSVHEKEELVSKENDMEQVSKTFDSVDNAGVEEVVGQHDSFDAYVADTSFTLGKSPVQNGLPVTEKNISASGLGEGSPKSERSTDMFCDDIFGDSPASIRKSGKDGLLKIERSGLHDNWDDAEGYYSHRLGEVLDGRYEIIAAQGKGVFSTVVRVKDLKAGKGDPEEVAIKIIRSNDTMYKAGMEELVILKKLSGADPEDKRHCVRFLSSFKYRNHLCLTFESLHMNLREVLKKFGRNIGLRLTAVRAYAKQLFIALKHLKNCGVLHCDIKPDNMLVNEAKNVLKLCDFGNAMFAGKNEITPYLVSRFYRAPEIILGLPYDHPLDIWSVGCCLFELYTGKVLFPGPSNNDMLRLHMELKGPFPKKMLRKAAFIDQHFDQDLNFHAAEEDPVTKKAVKRLLLNIKPKDIGTLISGSPGEDPKMLANFKDLLERAFVLDPEKRMTVSQALSHPFITGK